MYSNLLEHYATNSARTNHYILSFMMRLSNFTVSIGCVSDAGEKYFATFTSVVPVGMLRVKSSGGKVSCCVYLC